MEDLNGIMIKGCNFGGRSIKDEDLEEEEDSSPRKMRIKSIDYSSGSAWHISSAPRMIPKANTSTTTHEANKAIKKCSAPMDIPDWSKIYKKNTNRDGSGGVSFYNDNEDDCDEDDDDGDDMVPPHEWLARKLERTQISSFSVCEGIGRTLKGRDLSKVRNAILTKTGFLEQ